MTESAVDFDQGILEPCNLITGTESTEYVCNKFKHFEPQLIGEFFQIEDFGLQFISDGSQKQEFLEIMSGGSLQDKVYGPDSLSKSSSVYVNEALQSSILPNGSSEDLEVLKPSVFPRFLFY